MYFLLVTFCGDRVPFSNVTTKISNVNPIQFLNLNNNLKLLETVSLSLLDHSFQCGRRRHGYRQSNLESTFERYEFVSFKLLGNIRGNYLLTDIFKLQPGSSDIRKQSDTISGIEYLRRPLVCFLFISRLNCDLCINTKDVTMFLL